ncbi:hypothetical protein [Cumulibacter manganitolerans]|uniref:hypothetical protein n=1 Tax=Cumulibacter manganitolerans TaxID=1884992 RepID=UPI001294DECC|nr:hypothetical protein [Cumulibacter manganitolerans]
MYILVMRFQAGIEGEERVAIREGSIEKFRALGGLDEKYYLGKGDGPAAGGVYLFDTREHLQAYLDGPIVPGIQPRYRAPEPPSTEVLEVWAQAELPGPVRPGRRQIGSIRFAAAPASDAAERRLPPDAEIEAYAAGSGLQRLFWVRDETADRAGVIGVWGEIPDLDAELRGARVAALSGADAATGPIRYETYDVPRVLRERP